MRSNSAFTELMAYQRQTEALSQISGRLSWDQETTMPSGAHEQRAEECAALEGVVHQRRSAPQVADWLETIDASNLDAVSQAQLRHIRRAHQRATRVPVDLAEELARTASRSHGVWAQARADEDVAAFLPMLEEVVGLRQQEADALADAGQSRWDALHQDYEPGGSAEALIAMFTALHPGLVNLRAAALEAQAPPEVEGTFDEAAQLQLAGELAQVFGYDFERGRLDKAVHPFSSGSGQDVRITTRTSPTDPFNCIYSTIHEVGHACYEQNIDQAYLLTPLGQGVSMAVHESQSRIYENQLGRSRAFTGWLYGRMRDAFGDFGIADEEAFFGCANRVSKGYIRTESDEVQYNLHVMLRFDLELALLSGGLAVSDLESAWNDRFEADFGYAVDRPSNGFLQDVHWSGGWFGYFPTYSLGNVYAGCLHDALRGDVPALDQHLAKGDLRPATDWLRENVQTHGGLYTPHETITRACGGTPPGPEPLLAYLREKFAGIYGLSA